MPVLRSASAKSSRSTRTQRYNEDSEDSARSDVESTSRVAARVSRKKAGVGKLEDTSTEPKARARTNLPSKKRAAASTPLPFIDVPRGVEPELVPAQLTFDLDAAKKHLISVDARFADIFVRRACNPFEVLTTVDPFRTLAISILSQQISVMAARSVTHKFCRMYDPSLPEKYEDGESWDLFPTAQQVAATSQSTLRAAGLSQRKAEYLLDLAAHFNDGRISTQKLREATNEQLHDMLIAVRGIGPWTVHMFAIFSMRHPDILPVSDLGVQRGLARWALAAHSPKDALEIPADSNSGDTPAVDPMDSSEADEAPKTNGQPVASSISHGPNENSENKPPFALPQGLTVAQLRSRLAGKSKARSAILSPDEMEILTDQWKPYRSIGVYYLWTIGAIGAQ